MRTLLRVYGSKAHRGVEFPLSRNYLFRQLMLSRNTGNSLESPVFRAHGRFVSFRGISSFVGTFVGTSTGDMEIPSNAHGLRIRAAKPGSRSRSLSDGTVAPEDFFERRFATGDSTTVSNGKQRPSRSVSIRDVFAAKAPTSLRRARAACRRPDPRPNSVRPVRHLRSWRASGIAMVRASPWRYAH